MISLVLKEIVGKTLKILLVVDDLRAAFSDSMLAKKLEDFPKWVFHFLISQSSVLEADSCPWYSSLVPAVLPAPHCCFCCVFWLIPLRAFW